MNPEDLLSPDELATLKAGSGGETDTNDDDAAQSDPDTGGEPVQAEDDANADAAADAPAVPLASAGASAADTATPEPEPDPEPVTPRAEGINLPLPDQADLDAQLKSVRESRSELRRRWNEAEIGDDEYHAQLDALEARNDELIEARAEARALRTVAIKTAEQAFETNMRAFLTVAERTEGVPYTNPTMQAAFARHLQAAGKAATDAGNHTITADELFKQADKAVRAEFTALGLTFGKKAAPAAAPATATAAAAAAKARPVPPKTLGALPAAAPNDEQSNAVLSQIASLEGEDLEIAVARMSAAERRAYLRGH